MLIKEERVVTYNLHGITRDEYLTIAAGLTALFEDSQNVEMRDTAFALLQQMGSGKSSDAIAVPARPTAAAPITDPEPTRAIQVARLQDPNDDLSQPTISADDPRPARPVPGPGAGTFIRRPGN